jgi:hypothetical protein
MTRLCRTPRKRCSAFSHSVGDDVRRAGGERGPPVQARRR